MGVTNEPFFQTRIIRDLAKSHGLTEEEVRRAVMHQFKYVNKVMSKGDFESVRLRYFGIFKVKPRRLEKVNQNNNKKVNNE